MTNLDKMLIGMFILCVILLQMFPTAVWLPVLFGIATTAVTLVRIGAYIYERQKRVRVE